MNTVSMHRKYAVYTQYLDTMLEHSVVLLEGESKLDAYRRGLKELDQIAADLRKETNPHLYQDEGVKERDLSNWQPGPQRIPIISVDHERMEIEIDNCMSADELKKWKELNPILPGKILTYYNERLKALTK